MSLDTQSTGSVKSLLDSWNNQIRSQDLGQARAMRSEVGQQLKSNEDVQLTNYHLLLEARYQLLEENYQQAEEVLGKVEPVKEELDGLLTFYFHFFKGMIAYGKKNYNEALENYGVAGEMLEAVTDEIDVAEYHYKLAAVYYFIDRTSMSVNHSRQAFDIFTDRKDTQKRITHCQTLLGINFIDLHQYEDAEAQFLSALDYANKAKNRQLKTSVYHNLGLLYGEQNISEAAVRYLNDALEDQSHVDKVSALYLLTREYFKLGQMEKAQTEMDIGMKLCQEIQDQRYDHHFKLLKVLYSENKDDFEGVYKEGISYFKGESLWTNVQEYAEHLAKFYRSRKLYEKASDYYQLAIDARNKITKLEELK